jgi:hypothetical protein
MHVGRSSFICIAGLNTGSALGFCIAGLNMGTSFSNKVGLWFLGGLSFSRHKC